MKGSFQYLVKADADIFLDVPRLMLGLTAPSNPEAFVMGKVNPRTLVRWSFWRTHSRWVVPWYMYTNRRYPPYCNGPMYAMSRKAAECIFEGEDLFCRSKSKKTKGLFFSNRLFVSLCR